MYLFRQSFKNLCSFLLWLPVYQEQFLNLKKSTSSIESPCISQRATHYPSEPPHFKVSHHISQLATNSPSERPYLPVSHHIYMWATTYPSEPLHLQWAAISPIELPQLISTELFHHQLRYRVYHILSNAELSQVGEEEEARWRWRWRRRGCCWASPPSWSWWREPSTRAQRYPAPRVRAFFIYSEHLTNTGSVQHL